MTIIVTGAAGFIGSNIVKGLNDRGVTDIIAVDEMTQAEKGDTAKINNLSNLSNQLARYTGVIKGTKAASAAA